MICTEGGSRNTGGSISQPTMKKQNKNTGAPPPSRKAGGSWRGQQGEGGDDAAVVLGRGTRHKTAKQLPDTGENLILRETQSKNPGLKGKRINQPKLLTHER